MGRFKFHDLLHAHARGLVAQDAEGTEALERLLVYYLRTAWAANRHLSTRYQGGEPGDEPTAGPAPEIVNQDQAAAWLRAEQPGLLAALALPELGPDRVVSLIQALSSHLLAEGMWSVAVGLHRRAAGIAQERGNRVAEANALLDVAVVVERQGQFDVAAEAASRALTLYRDLEDRIGEGHALAAIGQVAFIRSRFPDAFALYERALEAYEEVADQRGTAKCVWRLAIILAFLGENASAAHQIVRAIGVYREVGDERAEADCMLTYSRILYSLGDFERIGTVEHGSAAAYLAAVLEGRQGPGLEHRAAATADSA